MKAMLTDRGEVRSCILGEDTIGKADDGKLFGYVEATQPLVQPIWRAARSTKCPARASMPSRQSLSGGTLNDSTLRR